MKISQFDRDQKGYFKASDGEQRGGLMTYTWAGDDRVIIDHTEVNSAFKGRGVGKQMVLAAVEFARAKGISIVPLCPFAKAIFDKNEDIRDVL
ncbi:N-acetyltransferase [Reichenbachiella carrageenanivorans]|uniref:N-acetyltransferase n=1 Tax=Reichenbachiella carrageenanivorans TaxID=2979869 RepID=A0ABY6CVK2_9BACT|nr:GNAT family N-acetyltransferase [Reichenbachiella carrageenanivorans]UXX77939.1 N-acetyltransferase [Reichenbachiella carrageenanivorans]